MGSLFIVALVVAVLGLWAGVWFVAFMRWLSGRAPARWDGVAQRQRNIRERGHNEMNGFRR